MISLTKSQARGLWMRAQRLDLLEPFGSGPEATRAAVEHLGYVQIDTIHVIERCHHHILFSRIPKYRRADLAQAQSRDKSVFEYWTHALSYVPTRDYRFFMRDMNEFRRSDSPNLAKVLRRIRRDGAISIRDVTDDVLVEKDHEWASRKPSKKALQLGFYSGRLAISERIGMLKKYELSERHFDWIEKPRAASEREVVTYQLDRALKAQAVVSLDSICHLQASMKPAVRKLIEQRVRRNELLEAEVEGQQGFWLSPGALSEGFDPREELTHILSPFDPLIIQRKRLKALFDYEHKFEAYLPKEKRTYGYFGLPVLIGDRVVAVLDLKTERQKKKLLIQKWTWLRGGKSAASKAKIEAALDGFEGFQLGQ
jgi:uncharacterized protein YcaQ